MNEDGTFEGLAKQENSGYAAMAKRKRYTSEDDSLSVIEKLEKEYPGIKIKRQTFTNLEIPHQSLIDSLELTITGHTDRLGQVVAFSPLLAFKTYENPLKLDNREYPIEFSYPRRHMVISSIEIPEGYEIESIPESIRVAMEDQSMQLTFSVALNGNTIQTYSDFRINRLLFLPAEYKGVKDTYAYLLNKHSEKVVLKKIN
ncbi:hypothetical protein JCM15548_11734 [Geofilum rubicundum JCM 15548]|uniref:DUF3858 domain-containing protein n=2 Tax=Geofilum TaxID=1236988 RepID=A0A0E9LWP1_9BACT|nr:hypothetical protein JCM15548_11734 [Geofilum rubicundum JCM 15548]